MPTAPSAGENGDNVKKRKEKEEEEKKKLRGKSKIIDFPPTTGVCVASGGAAPGEKERGREEEKLGRIMDIFLSLLFFISKREGGKNI